MNKLPLVIFTMCCIYSEWKKIFKKKNDVNPWEKCDNVIDIFNERKKNQDITINTNFHLLLCHLLKKTRKFRKESNCLSNNEKKGRETNSKTNVPKIISFDWSYLKFS